MTKTYQIRENIIIVESIYDPQARHVELDILLKDKKYFVPIATIASISSDNSVRSAVIKALVGKTTLISTSTGTHVAEPISKTEASNIAKDIMDNIEDYIKKAKCANTLSYADACDILISKSFNDIVYMDMKIKNKKYRLFIPSELKQWLAGYGINNNNFKNFLEVNGILRGNGSRKDLKTPDAAKDALASAYVIAIAL